MEPACPDRCEDLLVDALSGLHLRSGEISFVHGVLKKLVLPRRQQAAFAEERDRVGIQALGAVVSDSLDRLKDEVRSKAKEVSNADVADVCALLRNAIMDSANFDNGKVPARAGLRFVCLPYVDETPLPPGDVQSGARLSARMCWRSCSKL